MNRYFKNALLLTGSGLALRALGMMFRVVLAAKLGSQGMGVYQLVLTLYNVSVSLATAGLSVAAAGLTARLINQETNPTGAVGRITLFGLGLGSLAGLLQLTLAGPAAEYWLGDPRAALSLRLLAPSLPFMGMAAVWRGYFLARREVVPNVLSQMVEQLLRMGVVFWLLDRLVPLGLGVACGGVMLGTSLSEGISCGIMYLCYRKNQPYREKPTAQYDREIWKIILPLQGDRCLSSALHAAENALVPICLTLYLGSRTQAIGEYGALRGMAMPVVLFPFSFLAALSTLLLPEITAAYTRRQYGTIQRLISRTMVLTCAISILAGGACTLCGRQVGELLYNDPQVGIYLMALGPMIPFMYLEGMIDGILNGLGEQAAGFRYSLIDSILRIICVGLLLPRFGMKGFLVMMAASNCMTCYLNVHRMLVVSRMRMEWWNWVFRPVFCLGVSMLAAWLLARELQPANLWEEIAVYGAGCALYLPLVWVMGVGKAVGEIKKSKKSSQTA